MERLKAAIFILRPCAWAYLHSSMERLKDDGTGAVDISDLDLHSSMERLKVISLSKYATAHNNLHSSMERLKDACPPALQDEH